MAKSTLSVTHKRKTLGRPATGHHPVLTVRFPKELTERVDRHAENRGETRSEVMRRFVESGLGAEAGGGKRRQKRSPK
jgi:metal-responsive CopG/Arc/MetJ family transcriptional regulator